jgi:hypothetical protein
MTANISIDPAWENAGRRRLATARRQHASIACHWQESGLGTLVRGCDSGHNKGGLRRKRFTPGRHRQLGELSAERNDGRFSRRLGGVYGCELSIATKGTRTRVQQPYTSCPPWSRDVGTALSFLTSGHWLALHGNCMNGALSSTTALGGHHRSSWLRAVPAPHLRCPEAASRR